MSSTGERFERAVSIVARLRGEGGCPWDREQTFDSIKPYTIEETYEVLEAVDNRDWEELPGELGDLLLQVLFYSQMAGEEGTFSIDDVLDRLADKLIRRHPHVFGEVKADTSSEVLRNWEAIKAQEKKHKRQTADPADQRAPGSAQSWLDGVSSTLPGLLEARKLSARAARIGFDWPDTAALFDKLEEETEELKQALQLLPSPSGGPLAPGTATDPMTESTRQRLEEELGDLFFVLVNIARHLSLDAESALKKTSRKFRRRFQAMEIQLAAGERTVQQCSPQELEELWQQAKRRERETK
jgi:nucleoside triphosphate diphosphatase